MKPRSRSAEAIDAGGFERTDDVWQTGVVIAPVVDGREKLRSLFTGELDSPAAFTGGHNTD